MMKRTLFLMSILLTLITTAFAQGNGILKGNVADQNGQVVAGASIGVTGDQLLTGKNTVSDNQGNFTFLGLPAGTYEITVTKEGFSPVKQSNIALRAEQTIQIPIRLNVGSVSGEVDVKAADNAPIIDTSSSENSFNISGEFITKLPLNARQSWEGIWSMVPGAVTVGPNGPDGSNYDPTINGASDRSNMYKLNGFDIADSFTNQGYKTQFSSEVIQDVVIKTAGGDASTPPGEGGYINVTTKSGGNRYHGTGGLFAQPKKFNWTNVPNGTSSTLTLYQPDFSFGGPLPFFNFGEGGPMFASGKNKLWFFSTYRYILTDEGISRSATILQNFQNYGLEPPTFDQLERSHRFTGKITYALNKKNTFAFNYLNDSGKNLNNSAQPNGAIESALDISTGGRTYQIVWTGNLRSNLLWTAQYGYRNLINDVSRKGGDNPSRTLYSATGISGGNLVGSGITLLYYGNRTNQGLSSPNSRSQHDFTTDLTYVANFAGQHTLQAGLQTRPLSKIEAFNEYVANGPDLINEVLVNGVRKPFYRRTFSPNRYQSINSSVEALGTYVQDQWQIHRKLTLRYGIRFDNQRSKDFYGIERFNAWTFSPRLGVAYSLTQSDVIRTSWGRYPDILYVQAGPTLPGSIGSPTRTEEWDNNLDGIFETVRVTPGIPFGATQPPAQTGLNQTQIDSDLHPSYKDEFQIGYTRQLPYKMVLDAAYIQNVIKDPVGTFNTNILYVNGQFAGYKDVTYNDITLRTNLKNEWLNFNSFQLSLIRNSNGRFSFFSNYTYQKQVRNGTWADDAREKYLNPAENFKNDKLQRPHIFRLNGEAKIWWGFRTSAMLSVHSGRYGVEPEELLSSSDPRVTAYPSTFTLSNGRVVSNPLRYIVRELPRTADRIQLPTLPRLNLRLAKDIKMPWEGHKVEFAVDLFNVWNDSTSMAFLNERYTNISLFGDLSTQTQSPRGLQLSLRYRF